MTEIENPAKNTELRTSIYLTKKKALSNNHKPAISREVINDPVYTLSTASPCSSCNLGTAFPAAIISSIAGVAPKLQLTEQKICGQVFPQKQQYF